MNIIKKFLTWKIMNNEIQLYTITSFVLEPGFFELIALLASISTILNFFNFSYERFLYSNYSIQI